MIDRARLTDELAGAIERHEVVARYQPQIDLATGEFVGVESLARWTHAQLGTVPPTMFIAIAEESGLIHRLGRLMLEDALHTVSDWHARGIPLDMSVNVSANQLSDPEFFDRLDSGLAALDLPPETLTIEITESQPILEMPSVSERLDRLRSGGLGIAIDDYGTGHSSLEQLDRLPATELKIDHTLVQDQSDEAVNLMTTVIELSHFRGIRVVAEGVETAAQLDRVRNFGCDRAQGFFFGRPLPKAELEAFVGF